MVDRIGILGQSIATAIGAAIPYVVPSQHAALVRIEYRGIAGANSRLAVLVNDLEVFGSDALVNNNVVFTSVNKMLNSLPLAQLDGTLQDRVVAPGPNEYYLSSGQNIRFVISNTPFNAMIFRVVGTEVGV